jgi:predicted ArsR family transcriptional regulator
VAEGLAERRTAAPDGRPGRPPVEYRLSEAGRERAEKEPPLPLEVQAERARRLDNARKRRRMQRDAQAARTTGRKAAMAGRRLKAATDAARKAQAALLTAEIVFHAVKALADAGGDPSALLPEEADVLIETGCAVVEDGRLVTAGDWAEKFRLICRAGKVTGPG